MNYNFNLIEFDCNPDGELYRIEINRIVLSEKIANYPIVSVKEAKKLLKEGSYFTNVPYEITKMKHVKDVELVYRTGEMEEYFLPYYRFLVELPEDVKGMKSFGAYYVPAVEQKFIQNVK